MLRAIAAFVETLLTRQTRRWQLTLDGRDLSGDYLMVKVYNTRATRTRLKLAPKADPGDGLLDVVCIREHDRENLLTLAKAVLNERPAELESVESHRGKHLELVWDGFPVHLDAKVPACQEEGAAPLQSGGEGGMIYVDVVPEALTVVLPKQLLGRTRP